MWSAVGLRQAASGSESPPQAQSSSIFLGPGGPPQGEVVVGTAGPMADSVGGSEGSGEISERKEGTVAEATTCLFAFGLALAGRQT